MGGRSFIDISNKRFGKLVALKPVGINKWGHKIWLCVCDCGKDHNTTGYGLRRGIKSCGKGICHPQFENTLQFHRFGRLIALKPIEKNKKMMWFCKCDCGNECYFSGKGLRGGTYKSCKKNNCNTRIKDFTGQRFGKLTALTLERDKEGSILWICQCDCGNKVHVPSKYFSKYKKTETISCGCIFDFETTAINGMMQDYKRKTINKNMIFDLSFDVFKKLIKGNCFYCGKNPSQVKRLKHSKTIVLTYNGIDKVDPKNGYLKQNCVTCCKRCNWMKSDMSTNEFKNHIFKISKHLHIGDSVNLASNK